MDSEAKKSANSACIWVHRATFSYRLSPPSRQWEALWVQRPGWGLLKRKDLWTPTTLSESALKNSGYVDIESESSAGTRKCHTCNTLMIGVPGAIARRHVQGCGTISGEGRKIDEFVLDEQRLKIAEERLKQEELQRQLEKEAELKRERTEKIREEAAARQLERDRKKKLKEEAREQFRRT